MNATLQIFHGRRWHTAAIFTPDKNTLRRGIAGGGTLEYDIDYAVAHADNGPAARVSLR